MAAAVRALGIGLGAGVCGGSVVGAVEALYVLQSTTPSEYQAIGFACTLYGLVGGVLGLVGGVFLAVASRWLSAATTWCLAFAGVSLSMGAVVTHHVVDEVAFAEGGVPLAVGGGLLAGFVVLGGGMVWMGANLLTKTPLRILMTPKGTLVAWGGGLALAWIFALSPAPGAGSDLGEPGAEMPLDLHARPDIVLVVVDSLRADALGAYGAPSGSSPRLDEFAADAVTFEQFITAASWTRASVASLFTSMAVSSHGCASRADRLPPDVVTLAEALHDRGYVTAGWPNSPNVSASQGFGQGFDTYPFEPEFPLGARESTFALSLYRVMREHLARLETAPRVEQYYMPAEVQLARAKAFLDRGERTRDFVFVHLMEPHDPWFSHTAGVLPIGAPGQPDPAPGDALVRRARYGEEVAWADRQLGAFLDELRAAGTYDDSVIVVTSDHGEEFFEHGGWWHGTTLYDQEIRVPLLIKLPGGRHAGTRVPWQVRQVDVAPTLVDLAGTVPPSAWQGLDLFPDSFDADLAMLTPPEPPDADDPPPETPQTPWVALDWTNHPASRDALSEETYAGFRLQSLRRGGRKIIEVLRVPPQVTRDIPRVQYFAIGDDPGEEHNLDGGGSGDEAGLKATLESMVDDRRRKSVTLRVDDITEAERCRLCALHYFSGADCEGCR
ncbi:hypothetical protein LBMAG42_47090 [Deltaproteobacteria bacterium]|nr:hypothetical protein LBMAG42_47090 [Deltaproteobacteria bacterium]